MEASFTKPNNRLAWRAGTTGISRSDAVAAANAKVEEIREPTLAYVDLNIDRLRDALSHLHDYSDALAQDIYDASNAILSTAATFGLAPLGKAAHSLCDLMVLFEQGVAWNKGAVRLHIESIVALRKMTILDGPAANDIVNSLLSLVLFVSKQ